MTKLIKMSCLVTNELVLLLNLYSKSHFGFALRVVGRA